MNSKLLSRMDRDSVAILTFERTSKLNALNYELVDAIVRTLDEIEREDKVRAIVLTGAGRAFRLIDEAVDLALRIARFAPAAVTSCLHAVTRGLNTTIDEGLAIEAEAFSRMVPTAALRQGLAAFTESRG
jgi:enoyl-CoA hydratase/carnithine racemase